MRALGCLILLVTVLPGRATGQTVAVTSSSPPEAKLAAIDAHTKVVQQSAVRPYATLLDRLDGMLSPGGLQVHIVPAPAALLLYLWHGYRQYGVAALADRFRARGARVFALGGAASWLLHFLWITLPETVLRARLRRAFPRAYTTLLRLAFRLDGRLPSCPLGYAVVSPRRDADPGS